MKGLTTLFIYLIGVLFFSSPGACETFTDLVEKINGGSINWTTGTIQATGVKIPDNQDFNIPVNRQKALKEATHMAFEKLHDVVNIIQIDNQQKVDRLYTKDNAITEKIGQMIKNAKIAEQKYLTDGKVEVTVQMELRGGFSQLILPDEIKQIDTIKPVKPPQKTVQPPHPTSRPVSPEEKEHLFTGLIIDATGICARPSMVPIVLDENGRKVYGPAFMSRESAVQYGTSAYEKEIDIAKQNPRIGTNPLIVKGLRTEGSENTGFIISNTDALVLRSNPDYLTFLKKCRVVIVIDDLKKHKNEQHNEKS